MIYELLKRCLEDETLVALATVVAGPGLGNKLLIWPDGRTEGDLGTAGLNERVLRYAVDLLADHRSERASFDVAGEPVEVFVDVYPPPQKLIIVGAVHIAIPLVTFAKELGFRTVVVDARSAFATPERFSHADELILKWPAKALQEMDIDEGTYVVVLTHDEKLDNPALKIALESPARYIGALGSTRTHAKRVEKLKAQGVTDEQLSRIHAPIGLELGAQRPEEIAVSIVAEIVAVSHGIGSKQPKPMSHVRNSLRVSGVLLAAGESTRMGEGPPKQLLPWDSEPLARRITREAVTSRLSELVVVVGYMAEPVRRALAGLDVRIVDNPDYAEGQSTSVKAGLRAVDSAADAAMFLPADQPFLTSTVIDQLISAYQNTGGPVVMPAYQGRRGAPVLFDRSLFSELAQITGDEGGRQILRQHPDKIVTVPLDSQRSLLDIDTPQAYRQLLRDIRA